MPLDDYHFGRDHHPWLPYVLPYVVRKTSVYLDEADAARLARLAEQEGVSQSSLLRRAIRSYVPVSRGGREFALDGAGEGPGGSIADVDVRDLMTGFGE